VGTRIKIFVDSRLRIPLDDLDEGTAENLRGEFTHNNPKYFKIKRMGFYPKGERPIIRTWGHHDSDEGVLYLSLPRGGMSQVRSVLKAGGYSWETIDLRTEGDPDLVDWYELPSVRRDLWEHQELAVESILKTENCLVRAPTGSGKTEVVIGAISRVNLPSLVVVWESGLLRQWQERLELTLGLTGEEIGLIQGKSFRLRPITLAMQQTLDRLSEDKWREVCSAFGLVACEELSRWAARTFSRTIDRFPSRYRVGVSADERRKDKKEFLIHDMFGRASIDISFDELVRKGIIHDVEVRVIPSEFEAPWYREAAESEDQVADFNRLLDEMIVDEERNSLVGERVAQCVAEGERVLVFSHRVEHCRAIDAAITARGIRSGLIAGDDGEMCERTKADLRTGDRQVGVGTYARIALGTDIPIISSGVVASPIHNNKQFVGQVRGRLCRTAEGKSRAVLYYIWDYKVSGKKALQNLKKWNNVVKVRHVDGLLEEWLSVDDYLREVFNEKEKRNGTGSLDEFVRTVPR